MSNIFLSFTLPLQIILIVFVLLFIINLIYFLNTNRFHSSRVGVEFYILQTFFILVSSDVTILLIDLIKYIEILSSLFSK